MMSPHTATSVWRHRREDRNGPTSSRFSSSRGTVWRDSMTRLANGSTWSNVATLAAVKRVGDYVPERFIPSYRHVYITHTLTMISWSVYMYIPTCKYDSLEFMSMYVHVPYMYLQWCPHNEEEVTLGEVSQLEGVKSPGEVLTKEHYVGFHHTLEQYIASCLIGCVFFFNLEKQTVQFKGEWLHRLTTPRSMLCLFNVCKMNMC